MKLYTINIPLSIGQGAVPAAKINSYERTALSVFGSYFKATTQIMVRNKVSEDALIKETFGIFALTVPSHNLDPVKDFAELIKHDIGADGIDIIVSADVVIV